MVEVRLTRGTGRGNGSRLRLLVLGAVLLLVAAGAWFLDWRLDDEDHGAANLPAVGVWYLRPGTQSVDTDSEELARLMSLPYLSTRGYLARDRNGVTVHDEARAFPGHNLYVSAHAPEAVLMDMKGKPLHRWRFAFETAFPGETPNDDSSFWRRVHALPDGGLLAIFQGFGMLRLDRDSRLVWVADTPTYNHISVAGNGSIYTVTKEARILQAINPDEPVVQDFVAVLDSSGRLESKLSILAALERSEYADLLADLPTSGELFHTNSVQLLEEEPVGMPAAFRRGNILVSVRELDLVAVIEPATERVVWAARGGWIRQHEPTVVADGRVLLFDNRGRKRKSRVLEFDPLAEAIRWQWPEDAAGELYSYQAGSCARLPNGNTLITESEQGRALEITREGEVVWQFDSPHRAGPDGEYVAALWEVVRLDPEYFRVGFGG